MLTINCVQMNATYVGYVQFTVQCLFSGTTTGCQRVDLFLSGGDSGGAASYSISRNPSLPRLRIRGCNTRVLRSLVCYPPHHSWRKRLILQLYLKLERYIEV